MAAYDKGDTIPAHDVVQGEDDPKLAVIAVEQAGLGPNDTIVNTFTDDEKNQLKKMIRNKEFSQLEAGVIMALMTNTATINDIADMVDAVNHKFSGPKATKAASGAIRYTKGDEARWEDVGAAIGSTSRRSKGQPVSKPAAIKEINRILQIIAKRSKAKFGTAVDLQKISDFKYEINKSVQDKIAAYKKAKVAERVHANKVAQEFYKLVADLHREEARRGLPRSQYYIDKFAPSDKNIDKLKQFGGKPDSEN